MKSLNPSQNRNRLKRRLEVAATEDDSDSNDDDSFVPIETQAELARKDKHNKIVESAESLERVADRFDQIGEVEEPDDIQAVQEIVAKAEAIAAKGRELLKLKAVPESNVMAGGTVNFNRHAVPPPAALVQWQNGQL